MDSQYSSLTWLSIPDEGHDPYTPSCCSIHLLIHMAPSSLLLSSKQFWHITTSCFMQIVNDKKIFFFVDAKMQDVVLQNLAQIHTDSCSHYLDNSNKQGSTVRQIWTQQTLENLRSHIDLQTQPAAHLITLQPWPFDLTVDECRATHGLWCW